MVPILVLLTFAAFIAVGILMERRRAAVGGPAVARAPGAVPDLATVMEPRASLYLHPGHVWVRLQPDGFASVGASDFATNFVGALSGIELPEEGSRLRQGDPAWTLISARQRQLTQTMPLDGEIVSVNHALSGDADRIRRSPDSDRWILKIRPARLEMGLRNLFRGTLAETWKEVAELRLNSMLSPALGRVANDGGVWVANFGDQLDDETWLALKRDLFPPEEDATMGGAAGTV